MADFNFDSYWNDEQGYGGGTPNISTNVGVPNYDYTTPFESGYPEQLPNYGGNDGFNYDYTGFQGGDGNQVASDPYFGLGNGWDSSGGGSQSGGFNWGSLFDPSQLGNAAAIATGLGTAYKQWNDADKYTQGAEAAANRSDPFGQYRQQYGDKLAALYANPDSIKDTPGYQFTLNQGLGALDRSNAAKGYLGAGKSATDAMDYASGLASKTWNDETNRLSQLAGSQFDPANAGKMLMTGQQNAITSQNNAMGTIGNMLGLLYGPKPTSSNTPQININNTNTGGNNTAQGGAAQGGTAAGGSSAANPYLTQTPYNVGSGTTPQGRTGGAGQTFPFGAPSFGGNSTSGALINPDVQQWLQSYGIDPNSLSDSDLNILTGSGTWDGSQLQDGGGYFGGGIADGLDPSTQNILGDGAFGTDFFGSGSGDGNFTGGGLTDFTNFEDPNYFNFDFGGGSYF